MKLDRFIRDIPDFPKPGIQFKDITPLLRDGGALAACADQLAERVVRRKIDAVAGIESRGFLFATAVALRLKKGLIPIRKPNKLPFRTHRVEYELEYGTDAIEIHQDAVLPGESILLVDDLLATGGTMSAACNLVRRSGGTIAGCLFVIELCFLKGRERLVDVPVDALLAY